MVTILDRKCLVLAENICVGYQAAFLLQSAGWHAEVALDEDDAVRRLSTEAFDTLVIDLEAEKLDGMAMLLWNRMQYYPVMAYGICGSDNMKSMQMGRKLGCLGFFYLREGRLEIDAMQGMGGVLNAFVAELPELCHYH